MLATWRKPERYIRNSGLNAFAPVMTVFAAVLVMFGMIVPQPHHGDFGMDLPKVGWPIYMPQAAREDAIIVSISRDGALFVQRDRIEQGRVAEVIRKDVERGSERRVYIRADARTLYCNVKQVIDAVHEAGLVNVSFMAEQKGAFRRRRSSLWKILVKPPNHPLFA